MFTNLHHTAFFISPVNAVQFAARGACPHCNATSSSQYFNLEAEDDDEGEDDIAAFRELVLPTLELKTLWSSLYYDTDIKERLLRYATVAMVLADKHVNSDFVSWNRHAAEWLGCWSLKLCRRN